MTPAPPPHADRPLDWTADCVAQERLEGLLTAALTAILIPLWWIVDLQLEPRLAPRFGVYRLADTLVSLAVIGVLSRSRGLAVIRACNAAKIFATGAMVSLMLPAVGHYTVHLLGFTLVFWGTGLITSMPFGLAVVVYGGISAITLALLGAAPSPLRTPAELLAAAFVVVTASVIAVASSGTRRRQRRTSFEAHRRLDARRQELAEALGALHAAQTRLVTTEKQAALGRLLTGLSHEINNPLNAIANSLAPLREDLAVLENALGAGANGAGAPAGNVAPPPRTEELAFAQQDATEIVDLLEEATGRIIAVQQRLRAFVRGVEPAGGTPDIAAALRAALAPIQRGLPPGVRLQLELADLPPIPDGVDDITQMVLNVVQNAIEAVGAAGVVRVHGTADAGHLVIEVEDDGPGLDPELVQRAFEPFYTTGAVGERMGLGLAISREIASRYGGEIRLGRAQRGGAQVACRIPVPGSELPRAAR